MIICCCVRVGSGSSEFSHLRCGHQRECITAPSLRKPKEGSRRRRTEWGRLQGHACRRGDAGGGQSVTHLWLTAACVHWYSPLYAFRRSISCLWSSLSGWGGRPEVLSLSNRNKAWSGWDKLAMMAVSPS